MDDHLRAFDNNRQAWRPSEPIPAWVHTTALFLSLLAGVVAFLPFALGVSPWNAVTLQVPGNQGNWWHVLVGAPFFMAYPMIWLRLRSLFSWKGLSAAGQHLIGGAAALSAVGTALVELPFLLHLAGTSEWQRLAVLSLGFGIMACSAVILFLRRRYISPVQACIIGLDTAYLANAALCLVVYGGAGGSLWSRSGWVVTMAIVWPMMVELFWLFRQALRTPALRMGQPTA